MSTSTATPLTDFLTKDGPAISLAEAARILGTTSGDVLRKHLRGILAKDGRRVHLEALRVGGRYRTTKAAVERWLAKIQLRDDQAGTAAAAAPEVPASPAKRATRAKRAGEKLAAAGW